MDNLMIIALGVAQRNLFEAGAECVIVSDSADAVLLKAVASGLHPR